MLPMDFPLSLLLGVEDSDLIRVRRVALHPPEAPPAAPVDQRGRLPTERNFEADQSVSDRGAPARLTRSLFSAGSIFNAPTDNIGFLPRDLPGSAQLRVAPIALDVPDGLEVRARGNLLYVALDQLVWSVGTPPKMSRGGLVRVDLVGRCVMRLSGRTTRWVLDVRGPNVVLYEDRSPVPLPVLGRPPVESWVDSYDVPAWLEDALVDAANDRDASSPVVAVGLVLRHATAEKLATVAREWLVNAAVGQDLGGLASLAVSRAQTLARDIGVFDPEVAGAALAARLEREHLASIHLAIRPHADPSGLARSLTEVDKMAQSRIGPLRQALAAAESVPELLRQCHGDWWAVPQS